MLVEIKNNKIRVPLKGKDEWLVLKPEEQVRQEYICRLVNNYGFDLEQMAQEIQVSNSQRGQGRAMADIVIWKNVKDKRENNSPIIVVECKAEHITVREEDYFQGYNYASWAGADFFVGVGVSELNHAVLAHGSQHQLQVFKVSAHYPRRNPDLHGLLEGLGVFAGGVWHDAVQFGFDGFGHWCEGVQPKVLQGV